MYTFDPFLCYEKLDSEITREVIEMFNKEVEEMIGDEAEIHYEQLTKYAEYPTAINSILVNGGVVVVYRGSVEKAVFIDNDNNKILLFEGGEHGIPVAVERVDGVEDLAALTISIKGSDEGIVSLVDMKGNTYKTFEGLVGRFLIRDDVIYYVRNYRRSKPPDGGSIPTDRIVRLVDGREEAVWGSSIVDSGESIDVVYSPDLRRALVAVYRGWSRSRLYLVDLDSGKGELLEGGDYGILLAGWEEAYAYIRKKSDGDEIVVGDKTFKSSSPIQSSKISGDKLLTVELVNASHRARIYDLNSMNTVEMFGGERFTALTVDGYRGRFLVLRTSFDKSYEVDVIDSGGVKVVEEGVKIDNIKASDLWIESFDGTKVHGFLVSKTGHAKAVIIYGYGGFGVSQTPKYLTIFQHLLNLGYAIAVVNIRGGGEEGEEWHRAGMLKNKENTFKDFASFAKFFKSLGLKVVGYGISNGGLTIGAVITKWPELLDAAIIGYPVLDMLRYHKLYVGKYWIPEYGDPEDTEMREYLLGYSPYHNIPKNRKLPPTLVYTGLGDDRVHPAHAIKFALKSKLLEHPVYLRVETEAGHRGAQTRILARQSAYIVAFIEKMLGKQKTT